MVMIIWRKSEMEKKIFAFGLLLMCTFAYASGVVPLPELSTPRAWRVEKPELLQLGSRGEWLSLKPNGVSSEKTVRMLLKTPLVISPGQELYWNGAIENVEGYFLHILVQDSRGWLFRFHQSSRSFSRNSMYLGAYFEGGMDRTGEVLFRVFGLPSFENQSFSPVKPAWGKPKPPLKLIGLELSGEGSKARKTPMWFRNFRFSDRTFRNSELYYQFNNLEQFGEVSGLPSLSYGDILSWKRDAERFQVDWSVRSSYIGQPFLSGSDELVIGQGKNALPRELQLAKRIEFPVSWEGTYWVRVKYRACRKGKITAVHEQDYRLFVIRGKPSPILNPVPESADIGLGTIRISPERKSMVWEADEPWRVKIRFRNAVGCSCKILVRDSSAKLLIQKEYTAVKPEEIVTVDLTPLQAGFLNIEASQFRNGELVDRSFADVGRKERFQAGPFQLPEGVVNWKSLMLDKKTHVYFDAHISNRGPKDLEATIKCMDVTSAVSRDFEIRLPWSGTERLPGTYDFRAAEAALNHAAERGMKIQFQISMDAPEWVPSHFTQNPEGRLFGHNTYLFHGARLNTYHSPVIRRSSQKFLENLVLRFRNHPALQSYYILIEHPFEAPYKDWYEGFDTFTLSGFRTAMLKKYGSLDALNNAWRTNFQDRESIMPPYPKTRASNRLWLDWIAYRENAVSSYMDECIALIRKHDPERMIMMYHDGKGKGIMTANGGCHTPEKFVLSGIAAVDNGHPQRAEEHSVTNWAAYYPTQLDTSLFSMMFGGGENSFVKMFFPASATMKPDAMEQMRRKNTNGFNRFEKFIPLWNELRPARSIAGDIRYFTDVNAYRLQRKTTFDGGGDPWMTMFFLNSQVPFWIAPNKNWKQAKLVVMGTRLGTLEKRVSDEVVEYVKKGGNLLLFSEAGRFCVEDDSADWVLLKKFGIGAPKKIYGWTAKPEGVGLWKSKGLFSPSFRGVRIPGDNAGEILAVWKSGGQSHPLVTRKKIGQGSVFVVWAETAVPVAAADGGLDSLLHSVAEMCRAYLPVQTKNRRTWINLLKHKEKEIWFLLAMRGENCENSPVDDSLFVSLPEGDYRVYERINGKGKSFIMTAAGLRSKGIPVKLKRNEVAIFQLEKLR